MFNYDSQIFLSSKFVLGLIIMLLSLSTRIAGQGVAMQWAGTISGNSEVYPYDIKIDNSGNVYTSGTFSGTPDFDPGLSTFSIASTGGADVYVNKLDANGNFLWAKTFGGTGYDHQYDFLVDPTGDLIISGLFTGIVDFDPGPGTYTIASAGSMDMFIVKLNSSGNFIWARTIGGTNYDNCSSVATDPSGNIYACGVFSGIVDFDPGTSTYTLNSTTGACSVTKFNSSGNFISAFAMGAGGSIEARDIAIDLNGDIILSGELYYTPDFDPGSGTNTLSSNGWSDIFIAKYSAAGTLIWVDAFGGQSFDECRALALDALGNIYTTGFVNSVVDFDPGSSTYTIAPSGGNDVFMSKIDGSGNLVWAKRMGSMGGDYADGIFVDNSGNIYTVGGFYSTIDFDTGPGTNIAIPDGQDIFIHVLDNSGNFLWARQISGTGLDDGSDIAVTSSGDVYITGAFGGTIDFDPGGGTYSVTSTATVDAFVEKLSPCTLYATGSISGSTTQCQNASAQVYSVAPVAGAIIYNWTLPNGWMGTSYTNTISLTTGTQSGIVLAVGLGSCAGTPSTLQINVSINPTVTATGGTICAGDVFTIQPTGASLYVFSSGSATVNPVQTTTYSVLGISSMGCSSNSQVIVTVTVHPKPTIAVSNGTICEGKSYTIVPSGATNYSYSSGTSIVTPSVNASYSVLGFNTFGCASASSVVCNITVNSLPLVQSNSGTICSGNSFTVIPTGANTYTISGGSFMVSPLVSTSYSIFGTDVNGCSSLLPSISQVSVFPRPIITVNSGSICNGQSFTIIPGGANSYTFSSGGSVVSPSITSTYAVNGTNIFGCPAFSPAYCQVSVFSNPTISANSGSICSGAQYTISPSGASSYTITGGSLIVQPVSTDTYIINGTSSAGCKSTSGTTITVTVNPNPTVSVADGSICPGYSFTLEPHGATFYEFPNGSAVVSPLQNTAYSIIGTFETGCKSTPVTVNVAVSNTLVLSITGPSTICAGSIANLMAHGADAYNWDNGEIGSEISVSPEKNKVFMVKGATETCSNTASHKMIVFSPPVLTVAVSSSLICSGNLIDVTAAGAATYSWSTGDTGNVIKLAPLVSTACTLRAKGMEGCVTETVVSLQVNDCDLLIYPNPTDGIVRIIGNDPLPGGETKVKTFDCLGKLVEEMTMIGGECELDFSDKASGVYLIQVDLSPGKQVFKVVRR